MKPVVYNWKNMIRDYTRYLFDDKWYYCRHCRRPVEHAQAPENGDAMTCLDCGFADPELLRTILRS